ncbi:MAG: hypothetical protein KatS3mg111_1165 [Pirellulaceae bacterium]|nr:MAG: hypothetical protein KatS3mg111_1165 [Pirellulaceae bacterium]
MYSAIWLLLGNKLWQSSGTRSESLRSAPHRCGNWLATGGVILALWMGGSSSSCGYAAPPHAVRFPEADGEGTRAFRHGHVLYLELSADTKSPVRLPRIAAPLRSMHWKQGQGSDHATAPANGDAAGLAADGSKADKGLQLKPEPDYWLLSWDQRPAWGAYVELRFDAPPKLIDEVEPVIAAADGSVWLPAHYGRTYGEKIRYEPQPHKNTIGYWVVPTDSVQWQLTLSRGGRFTVAILQGCGAGQGGSTAEILLHVLPAGQKVSPSGQGPSAWESSGETTARLRFEVEETGHFQDFRWRHVGEVELAAGPARLLLRPVNIKRNALMDIRAVHLIPLPDRRP